MPEKKRNLLLDFLWVNLDIFAWLASNILGIPPEIITHKQNVDPKYKPI